MLTSPQAVTIAGTEHSLSRINQDNFGATYFKKGSDFEVKLIVRNSYEGKAGPGQYERHNVDLTYTSFDAEGNPSTVQAYTVLRMKRGSAVTFPADVAQALCAWFTSNADAIAGWES